jgi:hypothetical protein
MNDFIHVKGYPIITVKNSNGKYHITKKKFLFIKSTEELDFDLDFPIKIKYKSNGKIIETVESFKTEIILDHEPIANVENMMLCIMNYDNFIPSIDLMSDQEIMHYVDSTYYLSISGYQNLNFFINWVGEIFNKIDFKSNLNKTLCLFHLITKNLLNLNYIIISSNNTNSTFGIEFYKFIKKINPIITDIFLNVMNNKKSHVIIMSWITELMEFLVEFKNPNIIKICKAIFEQQYLSNQKSNFETFPLHEILFKTIIKNAEDKELDEILNKIIKIKAQTPDIFIRNSATWALTYTKNTDKLQDIMNNLFDYVKLQDISTFISNLSKNPQIQNQVIPWIFAKVKTNEHISYKNFAHIVERLTPNVYNKELLDNLKNYYTKENDPSIYAVELEKIEWHINIVNYISNYK